jgi:hypothetical protein
MSAALAAQQGAQMGLAGTEALIAAIPGKQEKALKQQLAQDEARLRSGHSMSKGQRDAAGMAANQSISARQQQMLAQMARGSAGGASGLQQANIAATLKGAQDAGRSVASDVNALDMAGLAALKADVQTQRLQVADMKQKNAAKALGAVGSMIGTSATKDAAGTGLIGMGQTHSEIGTTKNLTGGEKSKQSLQMMDPDAFAALTNIGA